MLKQSRTKQIMEILKRDGEVEIASLCRIFDVSDITIRRDLSELAKQHPIHRTHGGAMLVEEDQIAEPSYERRISASSDSKQKIAKKALDFFKNGDKVFLDSGSTTLFVAKQMSNSARNIVITNGLNIASEVILRSNISVIMIGGDLRRNTLSTRGALTQEYISQFHMDVAFLGSNAIDASGNVCVGNTAETGLKRAVLSNADRSYLLLDHSKFGQTSLVKYAHASEFTGVITDSSLPQSVIKNLQKQGVNLVIADDTGE